MRPVLSLCLAVLLALTSQALAVARGQFIAICAGGVGPTFVAVDASGDGTAQYCPDAALALLAAVPLAPALPLEPEPRLIAVLAMAPGAAVTAPAALAASARGPPDLA